jgi:NifU-like protein involved in Fe-S cluster formation
MEKPKDLFELYSNQILLLAADIPLLERLNSPDATISNRTKLCGSVITIDLTMNNNVIMGYAHEVKACALGQASASILAKDIVGKTGEQIIKVRDAVIQMLNGVNYSLEIFPQYVST